MRPLHALVVITHVGQHAVHALMQGYKRLERKRLTAAYLGELGGLVSTAEDLSKGR